MNPVPPQGSTDAPATIVAPGLPSSTATATVFGLATNSNIEDVLEYEVSEVLHFIPHRSEIRDIEGFVFVTVQHADAAASGGWAAAEGKIVAALCSLRSAHYVFNLSCVVDLPQGPLSLQLLVELLLGNEALLPKIAGAESFRVRSNRIGVHSFRSIDVERDIGELLHEKLGVPGKMKGAAVVVRADVIGDKVVMGVQLHNEELTKRLHPVFIRDASVRPNVAFALLHFAGVKDGHVVLDPFVGSGTILLEAAVRFPTCRLIGIDKSERVVAGAKLNAEALGFGERVELMAGNARTLLKYVERGTVDAVVTNPPWGVRIGKTDDVDDLYRGFLASAADALRIGGLAVILVVRWESFLQHTRQSGRWVVRWTRPMRTGDMIPVLFVIERVEDATWTGNKQRIHQLVARGKLGDGTAEKPGEDGQPGKRRVSQ